MMKKQLLTSSLFRLIEKIIVIVTSLMLTPYLINVLGDKDYGLWILILSVLGWFNVIDLGFPTAVQRQITIALEGGNNKRVNIVFSTSIVLFGGLGVLSAIGMLALAAFPSLFGVNTEAESIFSVALLVFAIKVLWDFLMNAFHGFFAGLLRFDIDANISSLNAILKALLVFILIPELHIWGAIIATLAADVVSNVLKVIYTKKLYKPLKFSFNYVSVKEIKSLFSFSKHVVASGIAQTLNSKVDPILVSRLFDLQSVAFYSVASRLSAHVQSLASSVTGIFGPVYTKMVARGEDLGVMFTKTTSINLFVASSLFLPLYVLGELFIRLWVGEKFTAAIYITYFFILVALCRTLSSSVVSILFAQANHKLVSVVNLIGALANIGLSIILGLNFGLVGVAAGTALGFLLSDVFLKLLILNRYNDYKILSAFWLFVKSVCLVFLGGALGSYLISFIEMSTWGDLLIMSSIIFPISLILSWLFLLDKELKKTTFELIYSKFKR
jgi:O-antigen/teichoic acid export membrane protein